VLSFLGLDPLPQALEVARLNQTMYKPVGLRSRVLEGLFEHGQRARPVVPRPVRRLAREVVRRGLRAEATSGTNGGRTRREYAELFAADRILLRGLGIDVARWDSDESEGTHPG